MRVNIKVRSQIDIIVDFILFFSFYCRRLNQSIHGQIQSMHLNILTAVCVQIIHHSKIDRRLTKVKAKIALRLIFMCQVIFLMHIHTLIADELIARFFQNRRAQIINCPFYLPSMVVYLLDFRATPIHLVRTT